MTVSVTLKGITWNHSRGYLPMVATSQRFSETHPDVEIIWDKRSLKAFGDQPVGELAAAYDLLVIDHPFAGFAAASGALVPLEKHTPADFMADQAANSVGKSHISYDFDGYHCAYAIDAATPTASYRPDLLEKAGVGVPQTWDDLVELARRGMVALPGVPTDTIMSFYMLCVTQGEAPFQSEAHFIGEAMGVRVLEQLRELTNLCTPEVFNWNPIAVYEAMVRRDDLAYCPFAYCYSNYARPGYGRKLLRFADLVTFGAHGRLSSTLGGTGLAISVNCKHLDIALEYSQYVASPECQRTVFFENGGQPGHRSAWTDDEVNRRSSNFFADVLPTLDNAYLRPRYNGYLHFQDHGGEVIRDYVRDGGDPLVTLKRLDELYHQSLEKRHA